MVIIALLIFMTINKNTNLAVLCQLTPMADAGTDNAPSFPTCFKRSTKNDLDTVCLGGHVTSKLLELWNAI